MAPRTYRLGRRAVAVDATRQAIVAAARSLLLEGGYRQLSLEAVAQRAGVVRPTVYYHFRSKVGLLEELVLDAERRAGKDRLDRAHDALTGVQLLRTASVEFTRFWAAEAPVFRTFVGLAMVDPDMAQVIRERDAGRRATIERVVERLRIDGSLGPGWSVHLATDALWLLTSFEAFDYLYRSGSLSATGVGDVLVSLTASVLSERRD